MLNDCVTADRVNHYLVENRDGQVGSKSRSGAGNFRWKQVFREQREADSYERISEMALEDSFGALCGNRAGCGRRNHRSAPRGNRARKRLHLHFEVPRLGEADLDG